MSNIELYNSIQTNEIALKNVERLGQWFNGSGMFKCRSKEQGSVLALACITSEMTPFEFLAKYHVYPDGTISKNYKEILSEFRKMGGKFTWLKTGDEPDQDQENLEAVCEFEYENNKIEYRFTMDMAQKAGLVKDKSGWVKSPTEMLRSKCVTKGVGIVCPEIFTETFQDIGEQNQKEPLFRIPKNEEQNEKPQRSAEPSSQRKHETTNTPRFDPETVQEAEVIDETPTSPSGESNGRESNVENGTEINSEPESEGYSGDLNPAILEKLKKVLRGEERRALIYLRTLGWIGADEGFGCLSEFHARQIIDRSESFLKNVKEKVA